MHGVAVAGPGLPGQNGDAGGAGGGPPEAELSRRVYQILERASQSSLDLDQARPPLPPGRSVGDAALHGCRSTPGSTAGQAAPSGRRGRSLCVTGAPGDASAGWPAPGAAWGQLGRLWSLSAVCFVDTGGVCESAPELVALPGCGWSRPGIHASMAPLGR